MDEKTKRKIATRRKELQDIITEQIPKIEAAEKIVAALKEIGEDTSELDNLISTVRAFTNHTSADTGAGSNR